MGELGAKGDRWAMVGDGAKVYVVLTLGLPVPTSTESESGAAAAERGERCGSGARAVLATQERALLVP